MSKKAKDRLLEKYEAWRSPVRVDFDRLLHPELWKRHNDNWSAVIALLEESQLLAREIRTVVDKATQRSA